MEKGVAKLAEEWNKLGTQGKLHFQAENYPPLMQRMACDRSSLEALLADEKLKPLKDTAAAMAIINKLVKPESSDDWVFVSIGFDYQRSRSVYGNIWSYTIEVSEKGDQSNQAALSDYFRCEGGNWHEFRVWASLD